MMLTATATAASTKRKIKIKIKHKINKYTNRNYTENGIIFSFEECTHVNEWNIHTVMQKEQTSNGVGIAYHFMLVINLLIFY